MRRLLFTLLLSCGFIAAAPLQAAMTFTASLVTVTPTGVGTFSYSVGGWLGGGTVTGTFAGTDLDIDGQLSSFDGEVTGFTASYSGGTIVAPIAFGLADLFGLVYDLDGGPLGDGVLLDIEGIGAGGPGALFVIGPGPADVCGTGALCGAIEGPGVVSEPAALPLVLLGLGLIAASAARRRSN